MTLDKVRQLVKEKRYAEAEAILVTMPDDATAQQWLEQVRSKLPKNDAVAASSTQSQPVVSSQNQSGTISVPPRAKHSLEVAVTTADVQLPYEILGPVYFQVSNKGLFSSPLGRLKGKYKDEVAQMRKSNLISKRSIDWAGIWFEGTVGQNDFEVAFFVSVRELQARAFTMGGDAVVAMRQDIDIDTTGFQYFYLQMYGTVIRYLRK